MTWMTIAKKEYLENVRNAWVIAVSGVFFALTLLASYFGSIFSGGGGVAPGFSRILPTIVIMDNVSGFLVPILAITVGFGSLSGERESGSLALLVAQPIRRAEIALGKWAGLFAVLATAVLVGFGLAGILVLARTGATGTDIRVFTIFVLATLAWGAAWTSVTLFLSSWFKRRGTTIAGAIGTWFLSASFAWSILTILLVALLVGNSAIASGRLPGWLIITQWINPTTAYEGVLSTTIDGYTPLTNIMASLARSGGLALYTAPGFIIALAAWIVVPLYGAYAIFQKRDV